jgi:hypothetical protein
MLFTLLSGVVWLPSMMGFGSVLSRGIQPRFRRSVSGMVGLAVVSALAVLVNFAAPLTPLVSGIVWASGVGLAWTRRGWIREGATQWEVAGAAGLLVIFVGIAGVPSNSYDGGLYHLQAMRWLVEARTTAGLVNLHQRLALNSVWLPLGALLQFPLARGAETGAFILLLPLTFGAAGACAALGDWVNGDATLANSAMAAMLIPVAWASSSLGSFDSDAPLVVVIPFALVLWVAELESDRAATSAAIAAQTISVFALLIKMSAAPLALMGTLLLLASWRRIGIRGLTGGLLVSAALVVPWMLRSVLLSGCIVYPAVATCISGLPWTPEAGSVERFADLIFAWARTPSRDPSEVLGNWNWFRPWKARHAARVEYQVLGLLLAGAWIGAIATRRVLRAPFVAPVVIALAGVAWWFATAPDPRFVMGFLLALVVLPLALALRTVPALHQRGSPGRCGMAGRGAGGLLHDGSLRVPGGRRVALEDLPGRVARVSQGAHEGHEDQDRPRRPRSDHGRPVLGCPATVHPQLR